MRVSLRTCVPEQLPALIAKLLRVADLFSRLGDKGAKMMQLASLNFIVICREQEVDRRARLQAVLSELGCNDVTWLPAVDGETLASQQGRARRLSASQIRLSYNTEDGGRTQTALRLPRRSSTLNPWSILGCSLSHAAALEHAKDRFTAGHKTPAVILESDAALSGSAADVARAFSETMGRLLAAVPGWTLIHLGGKRVDKYAKVTRNGASTRDGPARPSIKVTPMSSTAAASKRWTS